MGGNIRRRFTDGFPSSARCNVIVADIDWGFRTTHDELRNAVARTYNAVDGGTDVTKGANAAHGTARKASR
jgi:hypothetical protein